LRLLKAFAAIPEKPPELRESIIRIVEFAGRRPTKMSRPKAGRRPRR